MKFELSNYERKYFGLETIDPNWIKVDLEINSYIYFDNENRIRKLITFKEGYSEIQFLVGTENRAYILPTTNKGKSKKLTLSSLLNGPKPISIGFHYILDSFVYIINYDTNQTLISSFYISDKLSSDKLRGWVEEYIQNSDLEFLKLIENFKNNKRQNIKYKPGDIFSFRIDQSSYGFGQILLNINEVRNEINIYNNASLGSVFGASVLVRIFCILNNNININIDELSKISTLPSFYLMDNRIFYGEYPIIGNLKLKESDFDFPISIGDSNNYLDNKVYLNYGFIVKAKDKQSCPIEYFKISGYRNHDSPYRNNSNHSVIPFKKYEIENCIKYGVTWYWENNNYPSVTFDLRNPKLVQLKQSIFNFFNLNSNLSYLENCRKEGIKSTIEIIHKKRTPHNMA
jgi:hypothetical protein